MSSSPLIHNKVVVTVADLQAESGGPPRSVSALAAALAALGGNVEVVAQGSKCGSSPPVPISPLVKLTLIRRPSLLGMSLQAPREFRRAVAERLQPGDVLHDNGIWLPTNHAAASAARRRRVPFIVSPRGMLTPWALAQKAWKKRLAWWLYQRRDLQSARVLHATSADEAAGFRAVGLTQPIAVIPNGVEVPERRKPEDGGRRTEDGGRRTEGGGRRTVLFLSRIHPKKGLLDLVKAWGQVRAVDWRVVVAGNGDKHYEKEVKAAVSIRGLEKDFEFIGAVDDQTKWQVYAEADLFVLPTKSENFGIVVAEALASGLPVITTTAAPWEELRTHHCGWWVGVGAEPLAEALREAMALRAAELQEMGNRGRALVQQRYSWERIARDMLAVYAWVTGGGGPPQCVRI